MGSDQTLGGEPHNICCCDYCIAFLVLENVMIFFSSVLDLLLFYVLFGSVVSPLCAEQEWVNRHTLASKC